MSISLGFQGAACRKWRVNAVLRLFESGGNILGFLQSAIWGVIVISNAEKAKQVIVMRHVLGPVLEAALAPKDGGEENASAEIMANKLVSNIIQQRLK